MDETPGKELQSGNPLHTILIPCIAVFIAKLLNTRLVLMGECGSGASLPLLAIDYNLAATDI